MKSTSSDISNDTPAIDGQTRSVPGGDRPAESRHRPVSYERLCEGMLVVYAVWTFACHFTLWREGNLYDLYRNTILAGLIGAAAAVALFIVIRRRSDRQRAIDNSPMRERGGDSGATPLAPKNTPDPSTGAAETDSGATDAPPGSADSGAAHSGLADRESKNAAAARPVPPLAYVLPVIFAVGVGVWQAIAPNIVAFWWVSVITLAGVFFYSLFRERPDSPPPRDRWWMHAGVWAMAVMGIVLGLVVHRPDLDDAGYINMAAAVVEDPSAEMLVNDDLHGVEGVPLMSPVYRFHSFELLNAAFAHLFGLTAMQAFHWISAPLWAFFIPFALAYLFRLITPRLWFWNTLAVVFIFLVNGDSNWGYSNFAFVRAWHGKAVLIITVVPLLSALALRFMREGGGVRWILLFLGNVAALGFSSTAIWLAPVVTGLTLLSAARLRRRSVALVALGTLATVYLLAAGIMLKPKLESLREWVTTEGKINVQAAGVSLDETEEPVMLAIEETTGEGLNYILGLVAICCAWAFCPPGTARRYCAMLPLGVMFVILNPYWDRWAMANITGPSYSRALWALPLPLLTAIMLTSPLRLPTPPKHRWAPSVIFALLLFAYFDRVPRMSVFDPVNRTFVRFPPQVKIFEPVDEAARRMMEEVPPGSHVIVPWVLGSAIPQYQDRLYPVAIRNFYTWHLRPVVGVEDVVRRIEVTDYTAGILRKETTPQTFRESLNRYDIAAVAINAEERKLYTDEPWDKSAWRTEIRGILYEEGFVRRPSETDYEIWVRKEFVNSNEDRGRGAQARE